jgi:hypothetical protein
MANPIVTGYSTNDYFYTHTNDECKKGTKESDENCDYNKRLATDLEKKQTLSSSAKNKYNDTLMLYNRELIITMNLILGLCGLLYYIYVNKDVLPAVPKSMPDIKMPEIPKAFPVMNVVSK